MGNCLTVQISCDQAVNLVVRCLCGDGNYIHKLEENLEALQIAVQELTEMRDDLLRRVVVEECKGLQRLAKVQGWLLRVEAIEPQVDELLRASAIEAPRLCLCGYCSKNCISTYKYGKEVFKKLREVEDLKSKGVFELVVGRVPPPRVYERPIQPTVALETMLEKTWNCLMEDGVGILGLYGMGGVGKTALLTQINNKFCKTRNGFDNVIWVVVSKDLKIERIQEEIGNKLGLVDEEWRQKRQDEKAIDIFNVLRRKKFVLLLDDIWEGVTLTEIGVPFPTRENGCKITFTTRSREVCERMAVNVKMEVKCLAPDAAWDLFRKKVGENTLNSHLDIPALAKIVAQECYGLPLALNVIGEAMTDKTTIQEWRGAINVLTSTITEFEGMEDKVLPILKFSYDNLKTDKVKSCFLYCALFPEDCEILKDRLVDYWLGEAIIYGSKDRDNDENEGYEIIGTLVRACLLMEDEWGEHVKMHDVIRDMALWIASDLGQQKENFIVKTGAQLCQIPKIEDWKAVTRLSLMNNEIKNISGSPDSPNLITLLLAGNDLVNISGLFFRSMSRLAVLDLSWNFSLAVLPEEISKLVSLQYLNLSNTDIESLPAGLKELRKLIYLNVESTPKLQRISGISSLLNLQTLRLVNSSFLLNLSLLEELQLLKHLKLLTTGLDASVVERFLGMHKLAGCTRGLFLKECVQALDGISFVAISGILHYLQIESSDISEIKIDSGSEGNEPVSSLHNRVSSNNPRFQNLSIVTIDGCKSLRDLTLLLFAPNLADLSVIHSPQIEKIVSREKAVTLTNGQQSIIPFLKLESCYFEDLNELQSIYWSPLPFPCLTFITILDCPKLRKLPLNSESCKGLFLDICAEPGWMHGLEWEDEAIRNRFFSTLKGRFTDGLSSD